MSENKLYNEEQKERYLNFVSDNEGTKTTIRSIFHKAWVYEDGRNRDLCNFNLEEIGKVIEGTNPYSANVAKSTTRFLSAYISWAISQGLRDNNINPLDGVSSKWIEDKVDKTKKIHYSFSEFLDLLDKIPNNQDKSFLFLMFEGLIGERFSEIQQLTYSDIDWNNNKIFIKERNKSISVTKECIDVLKLAYDEISYEQYNPKNNTFTTKELLPSKFIFKNVKSPRSQEPDKPVSMSVLYNRLHSMCDYLHLEFLTPNSLKQSGMLYYSYLLFMQDKILGYDQLAQVGEKYNFSTISNTNNEKHYVYFNTFLMKDFLTPQNYEDLYGIEVEFQKK